LPSSPIHTFEDLDAWKVGRELANLVYSLTKRDRLSRDFGLIDQIRRAAVSAMSNVAEGFERGSNKDFVKFLFIARGSAGEVRSLLYVALDQGYITDAEFQDARALCIRAAQILWGLIKSLRSKADWKTGLKILFLGLFSRLGFLQL
jgi:four helix bundle protein